MHASYSAKILVESSFIFARELSQTLGISFLNLTQEVYKRTSENYRADSLIHFIYPRKESIG
jgi:hypothetical protein